MQFFLFFFSSVHFYECGILTIASIWRHRQNVVYVIYQSSFNLYNGSKTIEPWWFYFLPSINFLTITKQIIRIFDVIFIDPLILVHINIKCAQAYNVLTHKCEHFQIQNHPIFLGDCHRNGWIWNLVHLKLRTFTRITQCIKSKTDNKKGTPNQPIWWSNGWMQWVSYQFSAHCLFAPNERFVFQAPSS